MQSDKTLFNFAYCVYLKNCAILGVGCKLFCKIIAEHGKLEKLVKTRPYFGEVLASKKPLQAFCLATLILSLL